MRLYKPLPEPRGRTNYFMPEGFGVEGEVQSLLYAIVRMVKPTVCMETGLLVGDSSDAIGRALKDNGRGHLLTCDIDPERIGPGRERLKDLPITVHQGEGEKLIREVTSKRRLDFIHIDSGDPNVRLRELKLLGNHNINPGGIVCWHDACAGYENMYEYFCGAVDWPHLVFPSAVGFAVFQRPE